MQQTKVTIILYTAVLFLTLFLLVRSGTHGNRNLIEKSGFESETPSYLDDGISTEGTQTLDPGQFEAPLISFTRGERDELWISSWNGESASYTGLSHASAVYNGPDDRYLMFSGISGTLTLTGSLFAYDIVDGSTSTVISPSKIGECMPTISKVSLSPDGASAVMYLEYIRADAETAFEKCPVHPAAENGYVSYRFDTETTVYLGEAQDEAVWSKDSQYIYLDGELNQFETMLPHALYKIDVNSGNATPVESQDLGESDFSRTSSLEPIMIQDLFFCPIEWISDSHFVAVGIPPAEPSRGDLYLVSPAEGTTEQLTEFGDINCTTILQ